MPLQLGMVMYTHISQTEYGNRRAKLIKSLPDDAVVIIRSASPKKRNGDTDYPFRQDSTFYYFTGLYEPNMVCVIEAQQTILFHLPVDPLHERWEGKRISEHMLAESYGFHKRKDLHGLSDWCGNHITADRSVFVMSQDKDWIFQQTSCKHNNLDDVVSQLRAVKSRQEITLISKACAITSDAFRASIAQTKDASHEFQIAARFQYECMRSQHITGLAYPSIVASGVNACTLHYTSLQDIVKPDSCILMDAGAEYQHYAADITRVWPESGRFSAWQKDLYNAVLTVQQACIDYIKPGITLKDLQVFSYLQGYVTD